VVEWKGKREEEEGGGGGGVEVGAGWGPGEAA